MCVVKMEIYLVIGIEELLGKLECDSLYDVVVIDMKCGELIV